VFATAADVTVSSDLRHGEIRLAGHPPPVVLRGMAASPLAAAGGPMLGVVDEPFWPATNVELGSRWTLLLFTDGITDARPGDHGRLETAQLAELLVGARRLCPGRGRACRSAHRFDQRANGGPIVDDVAIFTISVGDQGGP
jgi:Stage II sporulation protein E (SpoIIE)